MLRPGRGGRNKKRVNLARKGTFNPQDETKVKHTRIGVWDFYEEKNSTLDAIPGSSRLEGLLSISADLPYLWRMIKDVSRLRSCWMLLLCYLVLNGLQSLLPAVKLWFSGQLLVIVETAVQERKVDKQFLFFVAGGQIICGIVSNLVSFAIQRVSIPINDRIKQHYSLRTFHAFARLDVPTFDDAAVKRQLEQSVSHTSEGSVPWDMINTIIRAANAAIQLVTQLTVLASVLSQQKDGILLAVISFINSILEWHGWRDSHGPTQGVWAATTKNEDYVRMEGLKKTVSTDTHRQEIVAGGMWQYLLAEFTKCVKIVGDDAYDFGYALRRHRRTSFTLFGLLRSHLHEVPQVVFTLRAAQQPSSIPVSLASLNLITQTTSAFTMRLLSLFDSTGNFADCLSSLRRLYEVDKIANRVTDGAAPFPVDSQSLQYGISIEFKNVSFKYPGTDRYVVHNTSFKIEPGQLCVIVGENGSGKSTILKLIARLYDPTEGQILIDGRDIMTIKLDDLRKATAVLFQDYTYFPLSIRENISLGHPGPVNDDQVREAAKLGGADEFIMQRLPDAYDTYLERPVRDHYAGLPEGTATLFGRNVEYGSIRSAGGMDSRDSTHLSGGQMQRIALSRTFMKSVVDESAVGLLLFDEPSASLDPTAEHDLFQRLRQLRGNKTMVFSSHRFGNLTRHADLILYMHDTVVVEEGTHTELLDKQGEYARIWNLQAQSFID